jgi:benzodiazapine receptor
MDMTLARVKPRSIGALLLSAALCFTAAAIGGAVTAPRIDNWYADIEKPWFTPPNAVFGPVWTVLFSMMVVVLWQIFRTPALDQRGRDQRRWALIAFMVQLLLNVMWSVVFFGLRSPVAAAFEVVLFLGAIVWTIMAARPVIGAWTWLLVPYLAWVSYAAALTVAIAWLNA